MEKPANEISGVFKYRSYEAAKEVIQTGKLWFSKPTAFKDGFDCSPEILVKHFDFVYSEKSDPLFKQELTILANMHRGNESVKQWLDNPINIAEIYNVIQKPVIASASVLCLCTHPLIQEVWNEYGDNGKGICLGFNIANDPFFDDVSNDSITQGPITYGWPEQKINYFDDKIESLKAIYLTKGTDFKPEKEFRMILQNNDGSHRFNKKTLTTITFGIQVNDAEIISFRQLCIDNGFTQLKYHKIVSEEAGLVIKGMIFHGQ